MDFKTFKRMHFHGVALLSSLSHHSMSNVFEFAAFQDLAILTGLLYLLIKLRAVQLDKEMQQAGQDARSWRAAKSKTFDTKWCDRLFSSATPWTCIRVKV